MIQLKKQFRMGGQEILTAKDFCVYFSPTDLLRHRKMAAGFVRHQMAKLSPWHDYHAELFYKAVFQREILSKEQEAFKLIRGLQENDVIDMSAFYLDVPGIWRYVKYSASWISQECYQLEEIMHGSYRERYLKVLISIWDQIQQTDLDDEEREQAFLVLSAGYFLSRKKMDDLVEYPLPAQEIELAFRGEVAEETVAPKETKDGFEFKASMKPYELTKSQIKSTGFFVHTIEIKKLTAVPAVNGATDIPVRLKLGEDLVEMMPGDYRYGSCINGEWIRIFPVIKVHDGMIMERKGNTIFVTGQGIETKIDCSAKDILDFDTDSEGNYILLKPGDPDYSRFLQKHWQIDQLPAEDVVEVSIIEDDVYLLNQKGAVFKNGEQQACYPTSLIYYP